MTLGELLKGTRKDMGRSLEQISVATKIHVRILKHIEADRYESLPARAFTRGFIISYLKNLGLDSDRIMDEYHDFLESKFAERSQKTQGHEGYVFERKEEEQSRRRLIILGSVAGVFAIGVLLFFKPQNHDRKQKHAELEVASAPKPEATESMDSESAASSTQPDEAMATAIATATPTPTPTPTPSSTSTPTPTPKATATPSASPSPTPEADPLNKGDDLDLKAYQRRIYFRALEDVWVRYQSDDRPVTAFILRKGRHLVIKAENSIHFESSDPSRLEFKSSQRDFGPLKLPRFSVNASQLPEASDKSLGAPLLNPAPTP